MAEGKQNKQKAKKKNLKKYIYKANKKKSNKSLKTLRIRINGNQHTLI